MTLERKELQQQFDEQSEQRNQLESALQSSQAAAAKAEKVRSVRFGLNADSSCRAQMLQAQIAEKCAEIKSLLENRATLESTLKETEEKVETANKALEGD